MHVQYDLSILLVYIFVLSVVLGILRNRVNTTAVLLAHAGYTRIGRAPDVFLGPLRIGGFPGPTWRAARRMFASGGTGGLSPAPRLR